LPRKAAGISIRLSWLKMRAAGDSWRALPSSVMSGK
jgi:hypothetical protein